MDCIAAYHQLIQHKDHHFITRYSFEKETGISRYTIEKLFGTFTKFRTYALNAYYSNKVLTSTAETEDPELSAKEDLFKYSDFIPAAGSTIIDTGYEYNSISEEYSIYCKSLNTIVIISKADIDEMFRMYSNFDGNPHTVNEICKIFGISTLIFNDIKNVFGWTHKSIPITNETLNKEDDDTIVEDLLQKRLITIEDKFRKRELKNIENKAKLWDDYKRLVIDPFEDVLKNWTPPKLSPLPERTLNPDGNKVFVTTCADWHIGSVAKDFYLTKQESWTTEKALHAIDAYSRKIQKDLVNDIDLYSHCELLLMGDLHHGFKGQTAKGTILECDIIEKEQFDAVFNAITTMIYRMYELFGKVVIRAVCGNHDGFDSYPLFRAIQCLFAGVTDDIEFHIYTERTAIFKIKDVMVLMDHGDSYKIKAPVPKGNVQKESYISRIILANKTLLQDTKQIIFLQGHEHHFEAKEFANFDYFMVGALPLGDRYSDDMNLLSRARQNCLVIDETGVCETKHYYIDTLI